MTNREKYLDGLSDRDLAELIYFYDKGCKFCPLEKLNTCCGEDKKPCRDSIEKWLGEKA